MYVLPIQTMHAPDPVAAARPTGAPPPPVQALAAGTETRNDSAGAGNDTRNPARDVALAQIRTVLAPRPDPDRPVGPPPAFEANLLEAERERLRAGLAEERHTTAAQKTGEGTRARAGNRTREGPEYPARFPYVLWGTADTAPATAPPEEEALSAGDNRPSQVDITL